MGCSGLKSLTIPNTVTSIEAYAFCRCYGLSSVTIPNSLMTMGYFAFWSCRSLSEIVNYATTPQTIDELVFSDVDKSKCILRVLVKAIDAYRTTKVWKDFLNLEAISVIEINDVSLNETDITLSMGGNERLNVTFEPANATNTAVAWTSSNQAVATVNENGIVKAVAEGTAVIIVSTHDGGKVAICTVSVMQHVSVQKVSLNKTTLNLGIGSTERLAASFEPANATNRNVTWMSSDTTVATINTDGLVTALAAGTVSIIVATQDGGKIATCDVMITDILHF